MIIIYTTSVPTIGTIIINNNTRLIDLIANSIAFALRCTP